MHSFSEASNFGNRQGASSLRLKRIFDIVICLTGLPFLAAVTLVVFLVMRLVSPGPVFFLQERVGFLGKRFRIYKFRTMKVAADTKVHQQHFNDLMRSNTPMVKLDAKGDSRLIPGGWLLRASGIDELPQLINVLRGDMSFVGPRPCLPSEYDNYTLHQRKRFLAVPGLTGLWQVSGKNRTTFNEMIQLDIKYAETKTILLDIYIMAMTIPALVQQIGDTMESRKKSTDSAKEPKRPVVFEFEQRDAKL